MTQTISLTDYSHASAIRIACPSNQSIRHGCNRGHHHVVRLDRAGAHRPPQATAVKRPQKHRRTSPLSTGTRACTNAVCACFEWSCMPTHADTCLDPACTTDPCRSQSDRHQEVRQVCSHTRNVFSSFPSQTAFAAAHGLVQAPWLSANPPPGGLGQRPKNSFCTQNWPPMAGPFDAVYGGGGLGTRPWC